jgi:threonine aldolase
MADPVIDLRSDTVTKPSPEMRRAMADAEVGDDVFIEDPTVNRLQERAAEIFRRPAALFVPSGTMGNLACIIAHTRPGQEVICEQTGHIYNYEMGSMSAVAGVLPRIVDGDDGILTWSAISKAIRPKIYYRPQTALISLENTHNMAGGTVYPVGVSDEICDKAHDSGIPVHLDGARIFNAAAYLDRDVAQITHKFDSVQFCLSKGLGAPVGSLIVGAKEFIERCRSIRKMLGGGMRQAGVLAAAGLIALETGPTRLHIDHANATILAIRLAEIKGITLDCAKVKTNIVIFGVRKAGWSSADFLKALAKRNVLALPVDEDRVRMVTHQDVDRTGVERAAAAAGEVIRA